MRLCAIESNLRVKLLGPVRFDAQEAAKLPIWGKVSLEVGRLARRAWYVGVEGCKPAASSYLGT